MAGNNQQQWERQQYYTNFGPSFSTPPPQSQTSAEQDSFTVFSDGLGNFLRVYPNQKKYERFIPTQPAPPPPQQFQRNEIFEQRDFAGNQTIPNRDSQGNFFINQLTTWTPGTSILGDRISSQCESGIDRASQMIQPPQPPMDRQSLPAKKPRAVAEVKPMRMSYSDVLSKNVPDTNRPTSILASNPPPATTTNLKKEKRSNGGEKKYDSEKFRKREEKKIQPPPNKVEPLKDNGKKRQKDSRKEDKNYKKPKASKVSTTFSKLGDEFEVDAETETTIDEPVYESFYNVRKTESYDKCKPQKKAKPTTTNTKVNSIKQEKQPYKRQKGRKNQRIAMLEKFCSIWFEYIVKFCTWLWSLVSDVVYLSFGLAADRFWAAFAYVRQAFQGLRTELGNNTNRPSVWIRRLWQKFDTRFEKDSKWAFWRGRKHNVITHEPKDYYKDGRLPSTADEAMYSLLNCKGKDAYSILGVTPDCSQEQIRKHYKKIAVLVHPDKNKQPGAEEAFKVLQRSFELVGEPENRQKYDQSVAEALNTEKAWSELNDLLKQLHTKIAEAANTIRCSSCCSRHPRKPTGRPHYAARECNSCKIRHSAREGDIWAETTLFGLKWRYLALMEGNVYDITQWANCQKSALSHLQPNSHTVQYRIVLGQNNQQNAEKEKRQDMSSSEPTMDDILSNIYSGQNQQAANTSRRRHKK